MSVPWVWRYHAYPDDYFRYSHRGVMSLFEDFEWMHSAYSTTVSNEFLDIPADPRGVDEKLSFVGKVGDQKRKYLPYLMVNMLGRRRGEAQGS
jgi:hypothetical protein